jgi:tetratricopeptide (TPR) repeat protein
MSRLDDRGCPVAGATPAALQAFERAQDAWLSWRAGADELLAAALREAPRFAMARLMQAHLLACSRDPLQVHQARRVLAGIDRDRLPQRERLHLMAVEATIGGDPVSARAVLEGLLWRFPRDLLALHAAHSLDHVIGDTRSLRNRIAAVLPAWSPELPGYRSVQVMHAFGLEECGAYEEAEDTVRAALASDGGDLRAHHVMAHLFEMTDRAEDGIRWMRTRTLRQGADAPLTTHLGWHLALFHLACGQLEEALDLYDERIRPGGSPDVSELVDAAALLWRIQLAGAEAGSRWNVLAEDWAAHIDDRFSSFNDLHAMLAFVGAGDGPRARQLECVLVDSQSQRTRHGTTTRQIGLPACRALIAFGRGDDLLATTLLASLPALAHRFGGSHAQRDVLHLTLASAIERLRRPARRWRSRAVPLAGQVLPAVPCSSFTP